MAETTRKIKNVRRHPWTPDEIVTVELEEVDHWDDGEHAYNVYLDGEKIGGIKSGMHQSSRHLFGNVAHFYKSRRKWFIEGRYSYSIAYESQAEAIRSLVRDHEYAERWGER